ncbi:flagellar assembly protein H [Vibrio aerogenes CECT 7868]|uniref:Flagellar assembly protein FliH n=1 Tax=Vibrio aerogenes CECT 7868 TaxID=1216006 RepID=A0A1M5YJQ1_9VIBR|nr:flagellar assembly protein FliH [Vibrio aerogenes]SHI12158.1 flagellar assembly protein H [Vibrio aerogenes CECT 7868]
MKSDKIMHRMQGNYRAYRFPPMAQPLKLPGELPESDDQWFDEQAALQEKLEAGFQQGVQQGYDDGLVQGVEQGKQQGLLEGQKEGFQRGFVSGEQSGKQTFMEAAKPVHDIYQTLSRWLEEREQQQRHIICELVQKVAQQVIRAELTLMPQQILSLVDETLEAMPGKSESVTVHLNPQDLERIKQINADLPEVWKLVANPELPAGGCQLVTEDAEADASCDSRLQACMDNVKQHMLEEIAVLPEVTEGDHSAEPGIQQASQVAEEAAE